MTDPSQNAVMMYDIRSDKSEASLLDMMKEGLDGSAKTMPTLLLYDEKGLKLFEKITYLDQYYLTNAEIEALTRNADEIAEYIPNNARVIELGSGNLRKVNIILKALERAKKHVDYYALDLSLPELQRTFAELQTSEYTYVRFNALHGTYDDGLAWLAESQKEERVSCILSLGSSIGNFDRDDAADFLTKYRTIMKPFDVFIIGLDACADPERVYAAYNDSEGVTEQFYRNGLHHANELFGYDAFKQDQWEVKGEYSQTDHAHKACYIAREDVKTKDFSIKKGERLPFEHSDKYSQDESDRLWHNSGLIPRALFGNKQGDYHVHILRVSGINFSTDPNVYAKAPSPSLGEWQRLWTAWDTVTLSMAPRDELMEKPIKLRNDLIFYLGHIPTFADIHFTKATAEKPTQPAMYYQIFERGIDPDVDDPTQCHSHSEIPDDWPPLPEILAYQRRVRNRVTAAIESGRAQNDRRLARGLWLAYEHEAMHLETFLYMLSQSDRILPPPGIPKPSFEALAKVAQAARSENKWHIIPASKLQVGLDDPQDNEGPDRFFTWDNETPARQVSVHSFEAQSRPISIGDYVEFLDDTKQTKLPASWIDLKHVANGMNGHTNGIMHNGAGVGSSLLDSKAVRTFFGPVPLKFALDWPVMASYDELAAFAEWSGGRIPTFEELRSIYHYVDRTGIVVENTSSSLVPAVNGHLSNEGVEETPPHIGLLNGAAGNHANSTHPEPTDAFINLDGRNIGFKGWHTIPVTGEGHRLRGQSDVGGLWEWSSTSLFAHDGFAPMPLYPGYTADFFDDKHNICLGGSWATVPRIAGRKSFVNWYQRNYPYAWCTARLARDVA